MFFCVGFFCFFVVVFGLIGRILQRRSVANSGQVREVCLLA